MDVSLKPSATVMLNRWRETVKTHAANIFSPPYLPSKFILFFLLTNITHFAVTVMNYSPAYWHSSLQGKGVAESTAFETSKTDWALFAVVYLGIALLCLSVFNFRWSLTGWFIAEIVHLWSMDSWLDGCNYGNWSITAGKFCEAYDSRLFFGLFAIALGYVLVSGATPAGFPLPQRKVDRGFSFGFMGASFGIITLLFIWMTNAPRTPTVGWVPLTLERNPPPLEHAAHAYDSEHNKLLMFGGAKEYKNGQWYFNNETWEWDGDTWRNVSPPLKDSPNPRTSTGMAYDEARDVFVLYGGLSESGSALCDTWEWDGETWHGLCPPKCPGARYAHEMYYDAVRQKVVLYGGYNDKDFLNDAWEWDGDTWTEIEIEGTSPGASSFALAYNPDEDLAFGLLSGSPGGTWSFQNNQWTYLAPATEPSNRNGTRLAYDPQRKIFVIFGGFSIDKNLNDTWIFDGKNWQLFTNTTQQPSIRSNTVIWYDEVRERVMLFGGFNSPNLFNDTWELILEE